MPRTLKLLLSLVLAALATSFPRAAGAADYVVQPEDVLNIRVSGEDKLTNNYTVDEQGNVTLDMVGKIKVAGLTTKDIEKRLTEELAKYLKLFEVSVFVVGEIGGRVLVYGEVTKQGPVKLRPTASRLLDALAEAGGPKDTADTKRITIIRKNGGKTETVELEAVYRDAKLNIELEPGDTVTVPSKSTNSVLVDGEVKSPGPKPLDSARTAFAALQQAQPTDTADWKRVLFRRKGASVPFVVDLSQVRTGQIKDDLELSEGDQLTILSKFSGTAILRGEVKSPGEKNLNGPTQLWDLITSQGGGFSDRADRHHVRVSRGGEEKVFNLVAVEQGLRRSDDPELELKPGDVVFIPTGLATVRGEVKSPGEKAIGNTRQLWDFLMQPAGGFTDSANRSAIEIIRTGQPPRKVDLAPIASGKKSGDGPEYEVLPGDVIVVPNNEELLFVIVGGVKTPGKYPAKPGTRLIDALALAGGTSDNAKKDKFVIAPAVALDENGNPKALQTQDPKAGKGKKDDPAALGLVVIDYKKMLKGDATQNVAINPGDRILIPEEPPQQNRPRRETFLTHVMRLLPMAAIFAGGPVYGLGLGGYGYRNYD